AVKALATVGGAIAGIFGEWSILMTILAAAMVLDYISGVLVAAFGKSLKSEGGHLDSKVGFVGLAKKALIIMIVLLATLLDKALGAEAMVFQTATVCYYIANEGISVVENAGLMGLPVPDVVKRALEQMKEKKE
ncbi:MAG: phage holin family protein, partial [Synergistaceae bacterium]|nr:phage holin family protein [Synergistaceae bacterium]